jgi:CelD/BcsL family acetyltransferase involved in cellulose biosynthesis
VAAPERLEITDPAWERFVLDRPEALPFHRPAWVRAIADTYDLPTFVIAVRDNESRIAAGIPIVEARVPLRPRRWIALPFTDYCPALAVSPEDEASLAVALDEARRAAGLKRVEVRGAMAGARPLHDAGFRHVLSLDGTLDEVTAGFHPSQVRRSIRRAESAGLVVRFGEPDDDLLEDFYRLHVATRRRLGVPVQPRRFFDSLRRHVLGSDLGYVISVEHEGRAVAAALFLASNRTLVYKFGASDSAAWNLRPNHLLFWAAIQRAHGEGYGLLDFGRSDAATEGLRAFKASWGAEEQVLRYTAVGDVPAGHASEDAAAGRAKEILGAVIRRSPEWVCRWSGELLYRYAM